MLLSEGLIYVTTLVFASFFTLLTFVLPYQVSSEIGRLVSIAPMAVRAVAFPIFSALSWFVLGIFSITANNCSLIFNACYTSPTYATTTSTATFSGFLDLGYLYIGFGFIMMAVSVIMAIMMYYTIMELSVSTKSRRAFARFQHVEGE